MDEVPVGGCKDVPNHVAIIMDGNGRWAQKRHLPAAAGHRAGAKKVREISEACVEHDIKNLTLFAFSTENWQRPDKEVGGLMDLMRYVMKTDIEDLRKKGVRLSIVGEREAFDADIVDLMEKCEELTAHNEKLNLNVAVNFGGRWDIVRAVRKIITKYDQGSLAFQEISEEVIGEHLSLAELGDPDLLIRTGGDARISNFLLWQIAYSEIVITSTLWPAFRTRDLFQAILDFQSRERRYGKISRQVKGIKV